LLPTWGGDGVAVEVKVLVGLGVEGPEFLKSLRPED
jgi:hypothetical protein